MANTIKRSTDGGLTWTDLKNASEGFSGNGRGVAHDPANNIWIAVGK